MNRKKIITTILLIFVASFSLSIGTYAYINSSEVYINKSDTVNIPFYAPKINGSYDFNQTINLKNTIINGKPLAPGAVGKIDIMMDFSKVDYSVYYKLLIDNSDTIPLNMKFYSDSNLTKEYLPIKGFFNKNSSSYNFTHYIFWKWEYKTDTISNIDDSRFLNSDIELPVSVLFSQEESDLN